MKLNTEQVVNAIHNTQEYIDEMWIEPQRKLLRGWNLPLLADLPWTFFSWEGKDKPNLYKIKSKKIPITQKGADEFNKLYQELLRAGLWIDENGKLMCFELKRTPSMGISYANLNPTLNYYTMEVTHARVKIIFSIGKQIWTSISFKNDAKTNDEFESDDGNEHLTGNEGFKTFCGICKKHDIDITKFAIDNGKEIKSEIDKAVIEIGKDGVTHEIYKNVHHLDYNSAYFAGICNEYPELLPAALEIYNKKKEESAKKKQGLPYTEKYKFILNTTQGYMQSPYVQYRYANLSKAGVNWCHDNVLTLAHKVRDSGRKILLFNTDGFWYQGDVYHDENEGEEMGQWKNDHINCKFRMRSKGAYEFVEDNKYYPVLRGCSTWDNVKPRSEWVWGDIYNGSHITFEFKKGKGIIISD